MRINTNTGRMELTKQEERILDKSKALLVKIAKHGEGDIIDAADVAADKIGEVVAVLNAAEQATA